MKNYDKLSNLVNDQNIRIINVVALPRSVSTAFSRLINESGTESMFLNEPINRNNRDLEVASKLILENIESKLAIDKQLVVIIKNMAGYLTPDTFRKLSILSSNIVWVIRDPLPQMSSLLIRMANDLADEPGAASLTRTEVCELMPSITEILISSNISNKFSRTGWGPLRELFGLNAELGIPDLIIDGSDVAVANKVWLTSLCEKLDINYSQAMLDGWKKNYINLNVGHSRFSTKKNAWTNVAANSNSVVLIKSEKLDMAKTTHEIQNHIEKVAYPIYAELTHLDNCLKLKNV